MEEYKPRLSLMQVCNDVMRQPVRHVAAETPVLERLLVTGWIGVNLYNRIFFMFSERQLILLITVIQYVSV